MIEDLKETEVEALDSGVCPDCGGRKFLEGPHGGCSVNIMCAGCGAKFNVTPGIAGSFGKQRIGRKTFQTSPDNQAIQCLVCGMTSYNQNDVQKKYCGHCHVFHLDFARTT